MTTIIGVRKLEKSKAARRCEKNLSNGNGCCRASVARVLLQEVVLQGFLTMRVSKDSKQRQIPHLVITKEQRGDCIQKTGWFDCKTRGAYWRRNANKPQDDLGTDAMDNGLANPKEGDWKRIDLLNLFQRARIGIAIALIAVNARSCSPELGICTCQLHFASAHPKRPGS